LLFSLGALPEAIELKSPLSAGVPAILSGNKKNQNPPGGFFQNL
jgi:hypothetical protein